MTSFETARTSGKRCAPQQQRHSDSGQGDGPGRPRVIRTRRPAAALVLLLAAAALCCSMGTSSALGALNLARFAVSARNQDGTPDLQAGSHPYSLNATLIFNEERHFTENIKDVHVEFPPGLVGNPQAVPQCPYRLFIQGLHGGSLCPNDTAVGLATTYGAGSEHGHAAAGDQSIAVYNLVPPPGVAAEFGYVAVQVVPVLLDSSVRSGSDYGLTTSGSDISQGDALSASKVTIWGEPALAAHDPWRGTCESVVSWSVEEADWYNEKARGVAEGEDELEGPDSLQGEQEEQEHGLPESTGDCPAGIPVRPLLTNPT